MPSKKKLRKQNQRLEDRYENLYTKFQHAGEKAWDAARARDNAQRELDELRTATRALLDAIDNGRQDDLPARKAAVRDLLPDQPWTMERIQRLLRRLPYPESFASGGVISITEPDDTNTLVHNDETAA